MTRRVFLAAGATGALLFVLVALVESVTRPGYDPVVRFVSELSLSDFGWMQIANFVVCGALLLLGATGLASSMDSRWVPALLGVYSLALIAAGLFTTDAQVGYPIGQLSDAPKTLHGTLHGVAGLACFSSLAAAALVASYRYRRTPFGAYCLSVGLVVLLGFIGSIASSMLNASGAVPGAPTGVFQRVAIVTGWTWVAVLALRQMRAPEACGTAIHPRRGVCVDEPGAIHASPRYR